VNFVEVAWLDIEATTATTRLVLEALGYETKSEQVAVPVAYEGMAWPRAMPIFSSVTGCPP
jgi:glycine betaine/proline transport system substrate-binding protein